MEIQFNQYLNITILLTCLISGFIIKKWVKDVDNKYIPTFVLFLGVSLQFVTTRQISLDNFIIGSISGLSSTGFHELFRNFISKDL